MLDRLNGFWTRLGIKPAVGNAFVTGVILVLLKWLESGEFNNTELYGLITTFVLSAIGALSPPEPGSVFTRAGVKPRR